MHCITYKNNDLAMVAVKAAIELDLRSNNNRDEDLKDTKSIQEFIRSEINKSQELGHGMFFFMGHEALRECVCPTPENSENEKITSYIDRYVSQLEALDQEFEQVDSLPIDRIKALSSFCCSLSKYAKMYWKP